MIIARSNEGVYIANGRSQIHFGLNVEFTNNWSYFDHSHRCFYFGLGDFWEAITRKKQNTVPFSSGNWDCLKTVLIRCLHSCIHHSSNHSNKNQSSDQSQEKVDIDCGCQIKITFSALIIFLKWAHLERSWNIIGFFFNALQFNRKNSPRGHVYNTHTKRKNEEKKKRNSNRSGWFAQQQQKYI